MKNQREGRLAAPPRALGLAVLAALTAGAVTYLAADVPITVHRVPVALTPYLTLVAVAAFLVMLLVDAVILLSVYFLSQQRTDMQVGGQAAGTLLKRVSWRTIAATAFASGLLLVFGLALLGLPLWAAVLMALLPWLPLYVFEAGWQYRHYGVFAIFGTLVALQLGHLAEHITQNAQLLLTHGNVAMSRGVFGQLDIETVHFYWNVLLWLGTGALLFRYGLHNVWLTAAFVIAGLHSVEHLYMYWLYVADQSAYAQGGSNGILALGGLIGSPLARPYLHLVYNVLEVTPFALAYWDESHLVPDRIVGKPGIVPARA